MTFTKKYRKNNDSWDMDKDIDASIDIRAIEKNINVLTKMSGTEIMPVLKADAYGHGMVAIAKVMRKLGIRYIGVATLGEAIFLRKRGDKGRILAWLYDIEGQELKDAFQLDIDIAIFDEKTVLQFLTLIPKHKKIKTTVFVDTGINRAGVPYEKAKETCKLLSESNKVELVGLMSHLVCSEIPNSPIVNKQLRKFRCLRSELEEMGIRPPMVHIANTGACLNYDVSDFTLARPGSGIYGISPDLKKKGKLHLAMTVSSNIIQLKDIKKGDGVGYDWKFVAPKNMRIAIVPCGYADFIPRDTSLQLFVYIRGEKRRVLGLISMDQIVVEADSHDNINDIVFILGNGDKKCPQTIYDLSTEAKTIPIEILCHAGYRMNRIYF
jgi:alanine racemase